MAAPPAATYPPANAGPGQGQGQEDWNMVQASGVSQGLSGIQAATQLHQQSFFAEARKRNRLNGSTPAGTAQNTRANTPPPGAGQPAASSAGAEPQAAPNLLMPFFSDDAVARQLTLGQLGANMQNETDLKRVEDLPVHAVGDVMRIVRGYHVQVIRPEMVHITNQVEQAL